MIRLTTRRAAIAALGLGAALTVFAPLASAQTVADIKKKGEITIGMLVDFPPYGTTNAQNQPDGYDADVAKLLAKDWGVKANIVPVTGPNRIPFLLTNKVDLLVASLAVTPERAKQVHAKLADAILVRRAALDKFEVSGNYHQQIVEVMGDAPRELPDCLHLLALMKSFLDKVACLDGVLVLGDVSEQDSDAFAGLERLDVIPGAQVERLEGSQALFRYRFVELCSDVRVNRVRKGLAEVHPDEVAFSRQPHLCPLVEISDIPIRIDDEDAVGHALEYRRDPGSRLLCLLPGILGPLLRVGQFTCAIRERVGHKVERLADPGDLRPFVPNFHSARVVTHTPLVGGFDQLPQRMLDEPASAKPG